jgi:hypothetical protein
MMRASTSLIVTDVDTQAIIRKQGQGLMEQGLAIEIAKKPGAALIAYRLLTQR